MNLECLQLQKSNVTTVFKEGVLAMIEFPVGFFNFSLEFKILIIY